MTQAFRRFLHAEEGVSSIEYAILGSFIGLVIISAISTVGTNLSNNYNTIATSLK